MANKSGELLPAQAQRDCAKRALLLAAAEMLERGARE